MNTTTKLCLHYPWSLTNSDRWHNFQWSLSQLVWISEIY